MAGAGCAFQLAFTAGLLWGLWDRIGWWSLPIGVVGGMVGAYVTVVATGALLSIKKP